MNNIDLGPTVIPLNFETNLDLCLETKNKLDLPIYLLLHGPGFTYVEKPVDLVLNYLGKMSKQCHKTTLKPVKYI